MSSLVYSYEPLLAAQYLAATPPQHVLVRNSYFERTPLRLCTAAILETGRCSPGEIRTLLRCKQIAEGFARSTQETRPATNAYNE